MVTGFKRPLTELDLWELQSSHSVEKLQQRFEKYWNIELAKKEKYTSSFVLHLFLISPQVFNRKSNILSISEYGKFSDTVLWWFWKFLLSILIVFFSTKNRYLTIADDRSCSPDVVLMFLLFSWRRFDVFIVQLTLLWCLYCWLWKDSP